MNAQSLPAALLALWQSHQQLVVGLAAGAVLSNPGTCALLAFTAVTKIPGVGSWMGRNPDKVKAWLNGFTAKIDELEDKYAAQQAPTTPKQPGAPGAQTPS